MGNTDIYDMIVVGGGPAGYTAALYAVRAGMRTVVCERLSFGGQMALTAMIDNYPGFDEGIEGLLLGERMRKSAERFGAESKRLEVVSLELSGKIKTVMTDEGALLGKTVALAMGARPRELGVKGERELIGGGVSYCAHCDGMFYRGKTVAVIGGGNSAAQDALILSRICKRVILVHRRDELRASKIYHEPIIGSENITFLRSSAVVEIMGNGTVDGVRLQGLDTGEESELACDGVFVSIGRVPETETVRGQILLDGAGYIVADESTRTSLEGVFAIGDVRTKPLRQIVTAVADGAVAVHYAEEYLSKNTIDF